MKKNLGYIDLNHELSNWIGDKKNDQKWWDIKYSLIENLMAIDPLLGERIHFLKKDFKNNQPTRKNALLLVVVSGLAWQLPRDIVEIDGDDRKWYEKNILKNIVSSIEKEDLDRFFSDLKIIEGQQFIYSINSFLRHPNKNYQWVLEYQWKKEYVEKLIEASDGLDGFLNLFLMNFDSSGWKDEIDRKMELHKNSRARKIASEGQQIFKIDPLK
jgi:hypothetical protein